MAQYTYLPTDQTYIQIEGGAGVKFRLQYDSNKLYLRQALNASPGFAGSDGTDYITIESYVLPSFPGAEFRVGVRSGEWVIDQTYLPDVDGFTGEQGVDWDNISSHSL